MANRSTPSDKILVDPLFTVPEGAEDQFVFSREGTDTNEVLDEFGLDNNADGMFDDGSGDSTYEYVDDGIEDGDPLAIPENLRIVSQKLRRGPGGQLLVDVVLEVDDVEGALKYEMRVTKI